MAGLYSKKYSDSITSFNVIEADGVSAKVGTPTSVLITRVDPSGNVLEAFGATTPSNGDAGYATGAEFVNTTGGSATTRYQNEGTATSATWVAPTTGGSGGGGLSIPFAETDAITTTGVSIGDTGTALTTGSLFSGTVSTGVFTTGGKVYNANLSAATAGNGFVATTTGAYTGTGLFLATANSATTGNIVGISATGLTTGNALQITTSTGMTAGQGAALEITMGAGIGGQAVDIVNTGAYTDTAGLTSVVANSLTTGSIEVASATGQTSGVLYSITGGGANLTTGIVLDLELGAATAGTGLKVLTSGVYAGSNNLALFSANSATTTTGIVSVTGTGLTSGVALLLTGGGTNLTTGTVLSVAMGAATAGQGVSVTSTGVYVTGSTGLVSVTANSATTTTGLVQVSATGLTTGSAMLLTLSGATLASGGKGVEIAMGAATTGNGLTVTSTGAYTAAAGNALINVVANSATTPQGGLVQISGTGLTTGVGFKVTAAAATLTTGFYAAFNDGALNVLTIGSNGHVTSNQTTAPTIAVSTQAGITAAAITAGSTDTCGTITTTGTSTGGTIITITFNKTYTTAPKAVMITAANAAGGGVNTDPIVTQTATTFVLTVPTGGVYAATPSWTYAVIA